jgi:hypothetical protein
MSAQGFSAGLNAKEKGDRMVRDASQRASITISFLPADCRRFATTPATPPSLLTRYITAQSASPATVQEQISEAIESLPAGGSPADIPSNPRLIHRAQNDALRRQRARGHKH